MASGFTMLETGKPGKRGPHSKVFTEEPKPTGKQGRLRPTTTASIKKFRKGGMVKAEGHCREYGK